MAKEPDKDRLLETWVPPSDSGDPIGFIATTFTFSAQFFEEDCLSAFLQMESDPDSEGLSYLIEREEKLGKVECAMVIADQHHSTSRQRNIRWDLLPFRMRTGIQHAKISLLVWGRTVRLVIGSANLTEEGYRRNQEIFAVFDAFNNAAVPVEVFRQAVDFLEHMLNTGVTAGADIRQRGVQLLMRVRTILPEWNLRDSNEDPDVCHAWPVFVRPGQASVFKQISDRWQARYSYLPDRMEVYSPFFDNEYSEVHPLARLSEIMTAKPELIVSTSAEKDPEPDGIRRVHLPAYFADHLKGRLTVNWFTELPGDEKEWRPMHMKALRASKGNWCMLFLGSSNFTTAGLGTAAAYSNYEANILYLASSSRDPVAYTALNRCLPECISLKEGKYRLDQVVRPDEDQQFDVQPLPDCILSAEADLADRKTIIRLVMASDKIPEGFIVQVEDGEVIYDAAVHDAADRYEFVWFDPDITAGPRSLPAGFDVRWAGNEKRAWLPLNVKNYGVLPPPHELKGLPFHILLQVLTSAKPLQVILRKYYRRLKQEVEDDSVEDPMTDPHRRVDTSGFLLQRTRRISYAFNAIREKLSRPVSSLQALHWRLYGPVGLQALVRAILSDSEDAELKLPEERLFFLAELIMELATVEATSATNYLPAETVKDELRKFILTLKPVVLADPALQQSWIRPYVEKAVIKATEGAV